MSGSNCRCINLSGSLIEKGFSKLKFVKIVTDKLIMKAICFERQ